jgi:thiamine monophosphate synthase
MNEEFDKFEEQMANEIINDDEATQQWMKDMLHEGVAEVIFTKKDGTERVMRCTLDPKYFPAIQQEASEVSEIRQKSNTSLAVFDVEAQAWRSFRYDSVKEFTIELV